jgi:hypothetical protein
MIILSLLELKNPVWELEKGHFAVFILVYLVISIAYLCL